jgi:hypothetical protein
MPGAAAAVEMRKTSGLPVLVPLIVLPVTSPENTFALDLLSFGSDSLN